MNDAVGAGIAGLAAGATDFLTRFRSRVPDTSFEAELTELVAAFRAATGRSPGS